jgi:DNA repair exonuclease SbcCD ATPase subunit
LRLTSISIGGFRAFPKTETIDLDADVVIVVGANGQGKTSLFDAILWGLVGKVPRLNCSDEELLSKYSSTGSIRVALELALPGGGPLKVVRTSDGKVQTLAVGEGGKSSEVPEARLSELLWPQATTEGSPERAIARSVYLQQDLLRDFIEAADDQQRFAAISELVGAGKVTDLQLQLDRERTAWSKATNEKKRAADEVERALRALEAQLGRLTEGESVSENELVREWQLWTSGVEKALPDIKRPDGIADPAALVFLDRAVKALEAIRTQQLRLRDQVAALVGEIGTLARTPAVLEEPLEAARASATDVLERARKDLASAQERAATERRQLTEIKQTREEMMALARLALRHLDEHCPVCGQEYDVDGTRARLEAVLGAEGVSDIGKESGEVSRVALLVEEGEKRLAATDSALRAAVRANRERSVQENEFHRRLRELGVEPAPEPVSVRRALHERGVLIEARVAELAELVRTGEKIGLSVARRGELARRTEVEQEIEGRRSKYSELKAEVHRRERAGELVNHILAALRDAAYALVAARLEDVGKVFQRIYSRVDPHPSFRAVKFLSKMAYGRGRVSTRVEDEVAGVSSDSPAHVLSSSQMNAMAVSIFLALNLGLRTMPLRMAILDDPLQSLDDINLLGLVDLLRRAREHRQLLVSTHDARFGALLARKLRPVGDGRTRVVQLTGWNREGPVVAQDALSEMAGPLRIAV